MNLHLLRSSILIFPKIEARDPLGRADPQMLSQQAQMELLVAGIHDTDKFQDAQGNFLDVADWPGVHATDGVIDAIEWLFILGNGSLCFEWLPKTLTVFNVYTNELVGTIDLCSLPANLTHFLVHHNHLSGSADLRNLPKNLTDLWLMENMMSGSLDLTSLPETLENLRCESNQFSGSIDVTKLPKSIKAVVLNDNALSGSLILSILPQCLISLLLARNYFSGKIDLAGVHQEIGAIDLQGNLLTGILRLEDNLRYVVGHSGNDFEEVLWVDTFTKETNIMQG